MRRCTARAGALSRPGGLKPSHALVFRLLLSGAGFAELWYGTNLLAAALGLFTLVSYLLLYTPLKRRVRRCWRPFSIYQQCSA
jgi:heme o synthase